MNYGRLRHRMQLEISETETRLGVTQAPTWYPAGVVSADINTLAGRELEQARQITADATHQIKTRYSDRFAPKQRLEWKGRYFYIEHVNPVGERNRETILTCVERLENG